MTSVFTLLRRACLMIALLVGLAAHAANAVDFFRAVNVDNASGVRAALEQGIDPNIRDPYGQVALYLAIRDDSPEVLDVLWSWPGVDFNARNRVGETPLMMAALKGKVDVMKKLLALGVPVQQPGWSPLHYAATGPSVEAVQLLLDHGAAVDVRSPNGSTPLMMAARYGDERSVDLLLRSGADLSLRNDKHMDAIDFATGADRDWMMKKLQHIRDTKSAAH